MSVIARVTISGAGIVLAAATCLQAAPPGASSQASQSQASQSKMSQPSPTATAARRALLDTYCVTCHNERTKTAGLLLDHADVGNIPAGAAVWEKVVGKLRSGAMPPAGRPRPDAVTTTAFVSWLETELDRSASASPNPGRPAIHRLNRVEYTNAVRDLLGLDIDGSSLLPADEAGYGFDNNGDTLSLSPALMGRYMAAAQTVSRLAVGDPTMRSTQERVNFPRNQDARMSEDLPFGSRGGGVIPHYFPLDGDYVVKVRLRRVFNGRSAVFGADTREKLDVRLDGARLKLFEVGGECVGKMKEPRCARPDTTRALPSEYERSIDLPLEVRFPAKAGLRSIQVAFLERLAVEMEGSGPSREPVGHGDDDIEDMMVDYLLIEGPINGKVPADTPSRRRIFVCRPGTGQTDTACATNILTSLARRAYRRPVTNRDVPAAAAAALRRASSSPSRGCWCRRISWHESNAIPWSPRPALPAASAISSSLPASRSSCGAASPTTSSWTSRRGARSAIRPCSRARSAGCWPTRVPPCSSPTSPASGSTCGTCTAWRLTRFSFRSSRMNYGTRSCGKPRCSSTARSATTTASWIC
jgi:mono/diheme cytochrome c family protein